MAGSNGYKNLVGNKQRARKKRRRLDDYETPPEVVELLLDFEAFDEPIFEPAAGSGRIVKVLRSKGYRVHTADIKKGNDFLKCSKQWKGAIVTNPPYRDGLADAFVKHALHIATGSVAMLLELKYMTTETRYRSLFSLEPPSRVIVIPNRINFYIGGGDKRIDSQFFNHAWFVWPDKAERFARSSGRRPATTTLNWPMMPKL